MYIISHFDIKITRGQSRRYCTALSLHTVPRPRPDRRGMSATEAASLVLVGAGLLCCNLVTNLLYRSGEVTRPGITEALRRYHASILYIRRNILTYLSMLLVLSMNITSNATVTSAPLPAVSGPELCLQNAGVLYRLTLGPQPALLARLTNCGLYLGFYMFLATNCCITVFRTPSPVSSV